MKIGTVNSTNKMVHDGSKGQKVTIIKSFFCNGEGHYLTKEIGEIPDMFVDVDKPIKEDKFKDCKHPNTKQGCCDFCGKDIVGE